MERNKESAQIAVNVLWSSMVWKLEELKFLSSVLNDTDDLEDIKKLLKSMDKQIDNLREFAEKAQGKVLENNLPIS